MVMATGVALVMATGVALVMATAATLVMATAAAAAVEGAAAAVEGAALASGPLAMATAVVALAMAVVATAMPKVGVATDEEREYTGVEEPEEEARVAGRVEERSEEEEGKAVTAVGKGGEVSTVAAAGATEGVCMRTPADSRPASLDH